MIKDQAGIVVLFATMPAGAGLVVVRLADAAGGVTDSSAASMESLLGVAEASSVSRFNAFVFRGDDAPESFLFRSRELVGRSGSFVSMAAPSSSAFGSDNFNCASAELEMQTRNSRIESSVL